MTEDLEIVDRGVSPESEVDTGVAADDMLSKSTVSKIVERERLKAFEKGKREALMEFQQQEPAAVAQQQQQQGGSLGGMQQLSSADIERMIAEKAPQMLQDHINQLQTKQTVDSFVNKMQAAEEKHPGLEEKLNDLDYSTMAPLISMANNMENTADIMAELLNNPMKMGNMMTLMYAQPKMAQKAMMDLSGSIKTNQDAIAQEKQAQDPMSQLKPSTSAGMDNSAMSVTDFRKMFRT